MTDTMTRDPDFCFEVDADKLWRMYAFASTEETRYYLCGVCIQYWPGGYPGLVLAATDGVAMGVWPDRQGLPGGGMRKGATEHDPRECIIQLSKGRVADLKKACAETGRIGRGRAVLVVHGSVGEVSLGPNARADIMIKYQVEGNEEDVEYRLYQGFPVLLVDGTFPDWQRVLPSGEQPGVDRRRTQADVDAIRAAGIAVDMAYAKKFSLGVTTKVDTHLDVTGPSDPVGVRVHARGVPDCIDFFGVWMPVDWGKMDQPPEENPYRGKPGWLR